MGLRRSVYYRLSPRWRRRARRIAFAPVDAWYALRGGRSFNGIPLPARGEIFTGGGDFLEVGLRCRDLFVDLGGLEPSEDVLEIGSGQGRMAIPLTAYLTPEGSYVGFDIVRESIEDCSRRITQRFPRFRFIHLSARNDLYTDSGVDAATVAFPLEDASFDFAFATSVFTHMEPREIENYLVETRRVVRPGGRFLTTLFLMDGEARHASERSSFRFPHRDGDAWYMALRPRSANVAIADDAWREMVARSGWTQRELRLGSWSGRTHPTTDFQDVAVLV